MTLGCAMKLLTLMVSLVRNKDLVGLVQTGRLLAWEMLVDETEE
jgi:hypothetical protein